MKRSPAPARLAIALCAALAALLALAAPAQAQPPGFTDTGPLSSDSGHVRLEWKADAPITLEMAREADFSDARELYQGTNHAYFLSGLAGGDYFLRLTDETGAQSAPVELTVVHQSLRQALFLTLIGALITLGILATIIRGARP